MSKATLIFIDHNNKNRKFAFEVGSENVSHKKITQLQRKLMILNMEGDIDYAGETYTEPIGLIKTFIRREFGTMAKVDVVTQIAINGDDPVTMFFDERLNDEQ